MGSALYIALNDLKSVIEEKWNTGSTDAGYPPRVVKVWEEKTVGYGDSRNPVILLKPERVWITLGLLNSPKRTESPDISGLRTQEPMVA